MTRQGDDGLAFGSAAQFPAGTVNATGQLVDGAGDVLLDDAGNPLTTTDSSPSVGLDTVNAFNTVPDPDNPGQFIQVPVLDGAGNPIVDPVSGEVTMQDLLVPTLVFEGTRRTAAAPGSIAEQSVRFDATYTLGGSAGYDLSDGSGDIETTVTYTVFVP